MEQNDNRKAILDSWELDNAQDNAQLQVTIVRQNLKIAELTETNDRHLQRIAELEAERDGYQIAAQLFCKPSETIYPMYIKKEGDNDDAP